ncbi:hypothetical protein KUH03_13790 [Sphingobacterium sp. E70]|nr:hypothetical protein KUH03_13790 [Sphingobacterium sp. E70]
MYEYFNGKLAYKAPTHVIIDVSGIGYYVHISLYTFSQIKDQENCKLFISLQVRRIPTHCMALPQKAKRSCSRI